MKKTRTGSIAGEGLASPPMATVQVPLPLLDVLTETRTAFFGLCLDAGQQVLHTMMEQDREQLCGPKHVPNPARRAVRGGSTRGEVTLGGRRILVPRLRARSVDGHETHAPQLRLRRRPRSARRPHAGGDRDRRHDAQVPPGARSAAQRDAGTVRKPARADDGARECHGTRSRGNLLASGGALG
jgi:hypothetical protein